ncbi:FCD domain-containing protein, partial [Mesorhizobium sp. M7A.F.Ca.AU.002.02.1.1]
TYTEHSEIARAMVTRDADTAARLMHDHIDISVADAMSTVREGLARIYVDVDQI